MKDGRAVRSLSLIERLESKLRTRIDKDDPFYWYFYLEELGKQAQTKEIVEEAITSFTVDNHKYTILKVISKKYITYEMCKIAVSRNGLNLKYTPKQYRDTVICLAAVQSDGDALKEVPEQVLLGSKGREVCFVAVQNDFNGRALSVVPDCYLRGEEGKALCEAAVRANGYALEHVPERWITKELARLAIETPLPIKEELFPDGSRLIRSAFAATARYCRLFPKSSCRKNSFLCPFGSVPVAYDMRLPNSFLAISALKWSSAIL